MIRFQDVGASIKGVEVWIPLSKTHGIHKDTVDSWAGQLGRIDIGEDCTAEISKHRVYVARHTAHGKHFVTPQ